MTTDPQEDNPDNNGDNNRDEQTEILSDETLTFDQGILDDGTAAEVPAAGSESYSESEPESATSQSRITRRKMLQGLAGTAVVAGGIAVTSNNTTAPGVRTSGGTTDLAADAAGNTTSSTSAGTGAKGSTVSVGDGATGGIAGTEANTGADVAATGTEAETATVGDATSATVQVTDTIETTPTTTVSDPPIAGQEVLRGANLSAAAPVEQRVLVLIELQGGSDGLSLVIPDDQRYRSERGNDLMITPAAYNRFDDQIGLHPSLSQVSKLNVATVEGVGPIDGNLSHFKMAASWERGDVNSSKLVSSGFCGRVADAVNLTNGFAGVSVAGRTGYFAGGRVPALVMSEANELDVVTGAGEADFRRKAKGFTNPIGANWVKLDEMGDKLRTGLRNPPANTMTNRGKELGRQLYLAAELIKADVGVKVLYANLGSFDTHDNQERRLRFLWEEFDYAVAGFFDMLADAGMADRALVATTSEFGRRVKRNARGTDHGSASNLIMVGPIQRRRYGAYPSLTNLDPDGNLKTEVPFDQYYATLCKDWMGVDPSLVLPGDPRPLGLT